MRWSTKGASSGGKPHGSEGGGVAPSAAPLVAGAFASLAVFSLLVLSLVWLSASSVLLGGVTVRRRTGGEEVRARASASCNSSFVEIVITSCSSSMYVTLSDFFDSGSSNEFLTRVLSSFQSSSPTVKRRISVPRWSLTMRVCVYCAI